MTTAPPSSWTTRSLLDWIAGALDSRNVESPRRMAELLLAHVLDCNRLSLYMETERPATEDERARLRDLVKRAMAHEPIQYLVGRETFYGLEFATDRRALIPRPSSATILDELLRVFPPPKRRSLLDEIDPSETEDGETSERTDSAPPLLLADIGTGTGCLAITAASRLPHATVYATDLSADALDLAKANAETHAVTDRVAFHQGDLLDALPADAGPFNAILSNPPYIPDHEWDAVEPNVKDHEPHSALRAGPDGLRFVAPLIDKAPERLRSRGLILIELAACTADECLARAEQHPLLTDARILKDSDTLPRVLSARRI
ncbi:MAG: peptide chain release factor N(5)-glutamine methyltransferase [Phycisphaerales bacterium JB040]